MLRQEGLSAGAATEQSQRAAKSARWDGLTFDIKGETIVSVEQIAVASDFDIALPLQGAFVLHYWEVAFAHSELLKRGHS